MNDSSSSRIGQIVSHITLALACGSLATACSGRYPLGDTSEGERPLNPGQANGALTPSDAVDARVSAALGPPDVTIGADADATLYPSTLASVGDLDGDGRDEMAVAASDPTSGFSFVHLRYGGPRPLDAQAAFAFDRGGAYLTLPNDDWASLSIVGAGDVDGDGYGDLLIDTQQCDETTPYEGTYLVYGGPERLEGTLLVTSLAAKFEPPAREAHPLRGYGLSCSGAGTSVRAGDLDGDGYDDLVLMRVPQTDTSNGTYIYGTGEGVFVFYGRSQRFSGQVSLNAADATFHVAEAIRTFALGDIDGDGRADLIVGADAYNEPPPGSYLLSGRAERYSGQLDLADSARLIAGAYATMGGWFQNPGDLDGDGRDDVLLWDAERQRHLFYGAPGLFADGLDFAEAAAVIDVTAGSVFPVGDRDGDGDDELLDMFQGDTQHLGILSANIALTSGSRERLSGNIVFPVAEVLAQAPEGPFPGQGANFVRALEQAIPAGDLDGDGAADLFTTSSVYDIDFEDETASSVGYSTSQPQVHIHYGTPAPRTFDVR